MRVLFSFPFALSLSKGKRVGSFVVRQAHHVGLVAVCATGTAWGKVDLVSLPERDSTQLTIYNSADLTLVRERRTLTLKKGTNRLEFGWANTLIDPTSVQLAAPKHEGKVRLLEVAYPPNVQGSAVWTVDSAVEGPVPVEITFFTSGISWSAFYMGTLSEDESRMRLEGHVRVENRSGEDYAKASTRVLVGTIHTVDEIADLARRLAPYGLPPGTSPWAVDGARNGDPESSGKDKHLYQKKAEGKFHRAMQGAGELLEEKKIVKEGLSEYFLYTIEGTEDIANGWGKRLPSFDAEGIPVRNLYRYEEERFGREARRFLYFKNDKDHKLGTEPLPNGLVKIYRSLADGHLSYTGQVSAKYIPIGQEVELDLGGAPDVKIEAKLMGERTENYNFKNPNGNISGWDALQDWQIEVANNRAIPVKIEITRNFAHPAWEIGNGKEDPGTFEKVDVDTVKYVLELAPQAKAKINYTLRLFEGDRRDRR